MSEVESSTPRATKRQWHLKWWTVTALVVLLNGIGTVADRLAPFAEARLRRALGVLGTVNFLGFWRHPIRYTAQFDVAHPLASGLGFAAAIGLVVLFWWLLSRWSVSLVSDNSPAISTATPSTFRMASALSSNPQLVRRLGEHPSPLSGDQLRRWETSQSLASLQEAFPGNIGVLVPILAVVTQVAALGIGITVEAVGYVLVQVVLHVLPFTSLVVALWATWRGELGGRKTDERVQQLSTQVDRLTVQVEALNAANGAR